MMRKTWWPLGGLAAVLSALLVVAGLQRTAASGADEATPAPAAGGPSAVAGAASPAAGGQHAWFGDVLPDASAESPAAQAAFLAVLREPPSDARAARLRAAYVRWMLEAPGHALANSTGVPGEDRRQAVTGALAALAGRQPAVFERYAGSVAAHGTDLAAVIGAIADQDPARALDWVRRHPAFDANGQLSAAVLPALMRSDVPAAARAVAAMKERASPALVQQVAAAYARHDPAQAYAWVRQLILERPDVLPARLLDDVSASLVANDPQAAEQFMGRTAEADVRASLMNGLALRKGQEDLNAAWDWLQRYEGDERYADVAQNLLYRSSYARPQEVARILPRIADQAVQAGAATRLAQLWQRRDAAGYEAWLASLPEGPLKTAALAGR